MIIELACAVLLTQGQQGGQLGVQVTLTPISKVVTMLQVRAVLEPLDTPQKSPRLFGPDKLPWEFPWLASGYSLAVGDRSPSELKLRVFSQEQKNRGIAVTRMLLRLWELNFERMQLIQPKDYYNGMVDVYLCFGGRAGGEQLFGEEFDTDRTGRRVLNKVNTIYIYDTSSFTDPVEMAREVAHEYGHATWPPVGGFKDPEEWADGYLAEKIFLRWIRDSLASKQLEPADAMGATKAGLDTWIKMHVDPLIDRAAVTEPTSALLADPSATGMNAFIGLAIYLDTLYSDHVLWRSLALCGFAAKDYPDAAVLAAEEPEQLKLQIPPELIGKQIWLPLGTGKLTGAAVLKKAGNGWVEITAGSGPIVVTNPH